MDARLEDASTLRWATPLALLVIGPLLGVVLGAVTNYINAEVSAEYFIRAMGWFPYRIEARAVKQGMVEGGALGLLFGLFFAIATAASTRMRCPLPLGLRAVGLAIAIVLACWVIGGVIGLVAGVMSPSLWGTVFISPSRSASVPRFAWVGGTIWGAYAGTLLGLLASSIFLHLRWKRLSRPRAGFPVLSAVPLPLDRTH